jgi:[ribosomal protein S18]-alanine N-acetyltransferase
MAVTDLSDRQTQPDSPHPNLIIERMLESDLEEVLQIEQVSFSLPWTRNMFETELRETTLSYPIVARWVEVSSPAEQTPEKTSRSGPVCGYSVFWHVIDEIHIGNLAVSPKFRRHGIALALIQNILKLGQQWQVKRISLEVRQSNESAIQLYHRFGFKEVAIRKKYYSQPIEDALVMVKDDIPSRS